MAIISPSVRYLGSLIKKAHYNQRFYVLLWQFLSTHLNPPKALFCTIFFYCKGGDCSNALLPLFMPQNGLTGTCQRIKDTTIPELSSSFSPVFLTLWLHVKHLAVILSKKYFLVKTKKVSDVSQITLSLSPFSPNTLSLSRSQEDSSLLFLQFLFLKFCIFPPSGFKWVLHCCSLTWLLLHQNYSHNRRDLTKGKTPINLAQ